MADLNLRAESAKNPRPVAREVQNRTDGAQHLAALSHLSNHSDDDDVELAPKNEQGRHGQILRVRVSELPRGTRSCHVAQLGGKGKYVSRARPGGRSWGGVSM